MSFAVVFPGQGSQNVGMGRELYDTEACVRECFAEAAEILGYGLEPLCFEGPREELTRTDHAQPALLTVDVACYRVLLRKAPGGTGLPAATAGHSLGEYASLVAAEVLSFGEALRVVQRRGQLMHQAPAGTMAAILGLAEDKLESVLEEARLTGTVVAANLNAPGQVVISGDPTAVDRAGTLSREQGARRVMSLPVSGAFHSPLMHAASQELAALLASMTFARARFPVITNVDACPHRDGQEIREALTRQMTSSVRWAESVAAIQAMGIRYYVECGPGSVLSGMIRRCDPEATARSVNDLASLQSVVDEIGGWQ